MDIWQTLATLNVDQLPLAGLVVLTVVLVLRGWLTPKTVTDDVRRDRDSWKAAYLESEKARGVLMSQNGELLEVARTANHILRSLPGGDDGVGQTSQTVRQGKQ